MRSRGRKNFADKITLPPEGGVVTRVSPSARDPGFVTVRIGRASTGRVPAVAVDRLRVVEGTPWTVEVRAGLLAALVSERAREFALRAAAARSLTRRQVQDRLAQRGVGFGEARQIAEDLAAHGLIDEAALARNVAEIAVSRKAVGKSLLVAKLRRRGIDAKMAEQAASEAIKESGIDPREGAVELAKKKARTLPREIEDRAAQRRVYSFLARRGFDLETCAVATKEALGAGKDGNRGYAR